MNWVTLHKRIRHAISFTGTWIGHCGSTCSEFDRSSAVLCLCWLLSECGQQFPTCAAFSLLFVRWLLSGLYKVGSCEASGSFTGLSAPNLHPLYDAKTLLKPYIQS